ncbi:M24 family metallopeptidase [Microbacterium sp. NPDC087589]|uniref:M24 family metallopeptidase n=1 Tax=Microbacterium sp. NPDC087589 TaxID=3364191 RepID=UPI003821EAFB
MTSTPGDLRDRERRLDAVLASLSLDAAVITGVGTVGGHAELSWLTGHVPDHRGAWALRVVGEATTLVIPDGGPEPTDDESSSIRSPEDGRCPQAQIAAALLDGARIGVAGTGSTIASSFPAVVLDIGAHLAGLAREVSPTTATALREHAEVVRRALAATATVLVPGVNELDIAAATASELARGGSVLQIIHASVDRFHAQRPSARRVAPGSIVTIFAESAPAVGGWVEGGIVVPVDGADTAAQRMIEALDAALRAGIAAARPGRTLGEVATTMAQHLRDVGEPTIGWGHSTGSDQGPLVVRHDSVETIRAGDALCLHPSVRAADGRSAGVATTVLIGTDTTEDLIPAAVRDAIRATARA